MSDDRPDEIPADEPGTNIGRLLIGPYEWIVDAIDRGLRDAGFPEVRPAHGTVFQVIHRDGSRVTDMAARAGMTKQAMTELVVHLERHGHMERRPDPDDGRARLVHLTRRGWECIGAARAVIADVERRWADLIGADDLRAVRAGLERLNEALAIAPAWPDTSPREPQRPR